MREFRYVASGAVLRFHDLPGDGTGGAAIVFLHGLGSASSSVFPRVAADPALAGRRSLLVDLLGFGYSDRPERFSYSLDDHAAAVAALLDAEGLARCCVVGHSMGGTIAIVLAAARPDLVGGLLVAEPNLDSNGGDPSSWIAAQDEAAYVAKGHAAVVARFSADPRTAGYAATVRVASPVAMHRSARGLLVLREPTAGALLGAMPIPRTLAIGDNLPYPDATPARAAGVEIAVLPNTGHDLMVEDPPGFAAAVAAVAAAVDAAHAVDAAATDAPR